LSFPYDRSFVGQSVPELRCSISTNVTNPPGDRTIEWDETVTDYEGEKSPNGDYMVVTVTAVVSNTGGGQANRVRATLLLPENFMLDEGEHAIKPVTPADIAPGETGMISWMVRVDGSCTDTERTFEVLISSENAQQTRCAMTVRVAEKPCLVNLKIPASAVGVTGQIVAVPLWLRSASVEPLERYRLMIQFDPVLLRLHDAITEHSRTAKGWRGPRVEMLTSPGSVLPDIALIDDLTLDREHAIRLFETDTLVFVRFEVVFDPEFSESGKPSHVSQSPISMPIDMTLSSGRRIRPAFNSYREDETGNPSIIFNSGVFTVTSPCAWPLESSARLGGNRPNPFNPSTTIHYSLEKEMSVTLVVLDIFGREIRWLDAGLRSAGRHDIVFDAEDLPGGVYFYQLRTVMGVSTRRMLLLR
jgi:hypothetical protein